MNKETKKLLGELVKLLAAAVLGGSVCLCASGCATSDFLLEVGESRLGSCNLRATPTSVETFDKSE